MATTSQSTGVKRIHSYGYRELDKLTGGLRSGDVALIGARPGMGKTTFILGIANHLAKDIDKTIAIFSLEASIEWIISRLQMISGMDHSKDSNLRIYDNPRMTVKKINTICENIKNLGAIIIDYFQLIDDPAYTNNADWSSSTYNSTSRDLKLLAQKFNVPVICTSQLSRKIEHREDKHPVLADLNNYGVLKQNVDQILFLYRDDYYQNNADYKNAIVTNANIIEVLVAKSSRTYGTVCKLYFDKSTCAIKELQRDLPLYEF